MRRGQSFHSVLGKDGEVYAMAMLEKKGYTIEEKNLRTPFGEIDCIARQGKTLCFIEIKTRSSDAFGYGSDAVTKRKQQRIIRAARYCLMNKVFEAKYYRFDVIEIFFDPQTREFVDARLITDAFVVG